MKLLMFLAFALMILVGCEAFQRGSKAAVTKDPNTGMTPAAQIASGAVQVAANPTNVSAWMYMLGGVATVVMAALGIGVKKGFDGVKEAKKEAAEAKIGVAELKPVPK